MLKRIGCFAVGGTSFLSRRHDVTAGLSLLAPDLTPTRWLLTVASFLTVFGVSVHVIWSSWPVGGAPFGLPWWAHALALAGVGRCRACALKRPVLRLSGTVSTLVRGNDRRSADLTALSDACLACDTWRGRADRLASQPVGLVANGDHELSRGGRGRHGRPSGWQPAAGASGRLRCGVRGAARRRLERGASTGQPALIAQKSDQ